MVRQLRKVLTPSAIGTLDWCAAQYLAEQQAFIRVPPSEPMIVGNLTDDAVSAAAEAVKAGEPKRATTIDAAIKTALAGQSLSDSVRAAVRMHTYALCDTAFGFDITATQVAMEHEIGDGWTLKGRADAVASGSLLIDWKASKKAWHRRKVQDKQYQILLYALLARFSNWNPSGGVFIVSSLEPKAVNIHSVQVDQPALDGALAMARGKAEYVERMWSLGRFPRRGGCPNCPLAGNGGCPESVDEMFALKEGQRG